MLREFREFIARGHVMDMAVGIIIGAAFTAIVTSLVEDLITPFISLFTGGIDFSGLGFRLGEGDYAATFAYGKFITAVIRFLIIAWVVFVLVKVVNQVKKAAIGWDGAPETTDEPVAVPSQTDLLIEIRDAIRAQKAG